MARKSHLATFKTNPDGRAHNSTPQVSLQDSPSLTRPPPSASRRCPFTSPAPSAPRARPLRGSRAAFHREGVVRSRLAFDSCHCPVPHGALVPFTSSPLVHPAQGQEFPPTWLSKPSQSDPACFAHSPYKNMAALRAPPQSRHAPGNRPDLTAGQEDGGTRRKATDLGTILGFTKGSIAGSVFLASGRIGSAGLSRSHCGLAHSPRPPAHCFLPPGVGTHAQSGS